MIDNHSVNIEPLCGKADIIRHSHNRSTPTKDSGYITSMILFFYLSFIQL